MTLEQFKKEKILAMKNKDKDGVDALNVIITKVMNLTIEKRAVGQEVTEGDVDTIIQKAVKELDFMAAAKYRDLIIALEEKLNK
jgi:uncharacterized protein YqeY